MQQHLAKGSPFHKSFYYQANYTESVVYSSWNFQVENCRTCLLHQFLKILTMFSVHIAIVNSMNRLRHVTYQNAPTMISTNPNRIPNLSRSLAEIALKRNLVFIKKKSAVVNECENINDLTIAIPISNNTNRTF